MSDIEKNHIDDGKQPEKADYSRELSADEMDAVNGGYDRERAKDGCAATYERDSWCWTNDYCFQVEVIYKVVGSD